MAEQLRPFLLVPLGLVLVGLVFTVAGMRGRRTAREFRTRAARAPGVVTEIRDRWDHSAGGVDHHSNVRRCPVVRFTLPDGREVETETPGANPAPAKKGASVTVLYDPESPTDAVLDSRWSDGTTGSGCITAFGIMFAALGAILGAAMLWLVSLD